jgi:hypothetical protein
MEWPWNLKFSARMGISWICSARQREKSHSIKSSCSMSQFDWHIKESWKKCFHMLVSLQDVYCTTPEANQGPSVTKLYLVLMGGNILRTGSWDTDERTITSQLLSVKMLWTLIFYIPGPWHSCLLWGATVGPSTCDLCEGSSGTWNMNPSQAIPYLFLAILPGIASLQQQCSTS